MKTCHYVVLFSIFAFLVLHTVTALKCHSCHYAYHAEKEKDKEFTDTYYNERDPSESRLHKDCGDDNPPETLLVTCPVEQDAVCWMGVFISDHVKGVARGCDVQSAADVKRSKQTLNSCWPTAKEKGAENSKMEKTNCYCNSKDGCSDWTFPGKNGQSIKRMLGGGSSGSSSQYTTIGHSFILTVTIIIFFLY